MISTLLLDSFFFFFNDTATTEIYTLSLHDALPISSFYVNPASGDYFSVTGGDFTVEADGRSGFRLDTYDDGSTVETFKGDRKSTRLNSSHGYISYAVFCLKKKK